jgi:hypothetical protein
VEPYINEHLVRWVAFAFGFVLTTTICILPTRSDPSVIFLTTSLSSGCVVERQSDYEFEEYNCIQDVHRDAADLRNRGEIVAVNFCLVA